MTDEPTFGQRWQESRPSKAMLFWACVASVILTLIIGFSWGGWVTGGTAETMAERAAKDARADLIATVCVDRFLGAPDAEAQLAALKETTSSWQQRQLIEEGGWATVPGIEEQNSQAAGLCADKLADATVPPKEAAATQSAVQ